MGRNTTGPPRPAPWWVTLHRRGVLQTTTDVRRQQAKQYWPSYTMCRWASNKHAYYFDTRAIYNYTIKTK